MNEAQQHSLWRLSLLSIGMFLLCLVGVWLANQSIFFTDFALHATLETTGSVLMLLLALFIFKFDNNQYSLTRFHGVALALIGMGILNLFHAASSSESYFIWPHAISTLVGSVLLLAVFLPERQVSARFYFWLPFAVALLVTMIALLIDDRFLPVALVIGNHFSDIVLSLYGLSTLLYLISASYFIARFWQQQQCQDFYLATVILLLATAAFLFHLTQLWDISWWYWHGIKLLAFFVVVLYFIGFITIKNQQFISREVESNIIKYSVDAIITKSLDNRVLTWNASAERLFGYTDDEAIGQLITMLYQPNWEQQETEITQRIMQGQAFSQFETAFLDKQQQLIDVAITLSPIKNSQGQIIGISKIVRDIREKKLAEEKIRNINIELERKVNERTAQLQNAYDEMEAFTYSVSHDLRSPLRATDGFSQALLEDYNDALDETAKDYLNRIRAASQKMAGLIDDLLQLSRQTRTDMQPEIINLSEIVQRIMNELARQEPERHVNVIIMPELKVYADAHLMQIALTNLLGNAWKYTAKQAQARIEFSAKMENNERVFFIQDNGAGFDMTYVDKLFKPFQRLHTAQEFAGNGIGLAMVYRIIKRHFGRVWAQGEPEKGATFFFTLGLTDTKQ